MNKEFLQTAKQHNLRPIIVKATKRGLKKWWSIYDRYPGNYLVKFTNTEKPVVFLTPKSYERLVLSQIVETKLEELLKQYNIAVGD